MVVRRSQVAGWGGGDISQPQGGTGPQGDRGPGPTNRTNFIPVTDAFATLTAAWTPAPVWQAAPAAHGRSEEIKSDGRFRGNAEAQATSLGQSQPDVSGLCPKSADVFQGWKRSVRVTPPAEPGPAAPPILQVGGGPEAARPPRLQTTSPSETPSAKEEEEEQDPASLLCFNVQPQNCDDPGEKILPALICPVSHVVVNISLFPLVPHRGASLLTGFKWLASASSFAWYRS